MRDVVIKKIKLDITNRGRWWGQTDYLVKIDHTTHMIRFAPCRENSSSPSVVAVMNFLTHDKDIIKELRWALTSYVRKYPISVDNYHTEYSQGIRLYVHDGYCDWAKPYVRRLVCHWHFSCYEKMNSGIPDMFSGDLLEMLNAVAVSANFPRPIDWYTNRSKRMSFAYAKYHKREFKFYESICGTQSIKK